MKRNDPEVIEGAVYKDRDRRMEGRTLSVERIYHMGGEEDYAQCVPVSSVPPHVRVGGRQVSILLSRLRSRSYALVCTPASAPLIRMGEGARA